MTSVSMHLFLWPIFKLAWKDKNPLIINIILTTLMPKKMKAPAPLLPVLRVIARTNIPLKGNLLLPFLKIWVSKQKLPVWRLLPKNHPLMTFSLQAALTNLEKLDSLSGQIYKRSFSKNLSAWLPLRHQRSLCPSEHFESSLLCLEFDSSMLEAMGLPMKVIN